MHLVHTGQVVQINAHFYNLCVCVFKCLLFVEINLYGKKLRFFSAPQHL